MGGQFRKKQDRFNPGDLVLAYSDGVVETTDSAGAEWGVDGLRKAVDGSSGQPAENTVRAVFTALDKFSQGSQRDDATVVVVRVC